MGTTRPLTVTNDARCLLKSCSLATAGSANPKPRRGGGGAEARVGAGASAVYEVTWVVVRGGIERTKTVLVGVTVGAISCTMVDVMSKDVVVVVKVSVAIAAWTVAVEISAV